MCASNEKRQVTPIFLLLRVVSPFSFMCLEDFLLVTDFQKFDCYVPYEVFFFHFFKCCIAFIEFLETMNLVFIKYKKKCYYFVNYFFCSIPEIQLQYFILLYVVSNATRFCSFPSTLYILCFSSGCFVSAVIS